MSEMPPLSDRRAKLSPEQLRLLQQRLKGSGPADPALADDAHAPARGAIARTAPDGPAPLSFAQQGQWFLWQLDPGNTAYHIGGALGFSGALDAAALHAGLQSLVQRHAALRTVFAADPQGLPSQRVRPALRVDMPLVDLSALDEAERTARYREAVLQSCRAPFDLVAGPPLRCTLVKMAADEHQLLLMLHHIVGDAWSVECMLDELAQGYAMRLQGTDVVLAAPEIAYVDFARWQRQWMAGAEGERQLAWWRDRLGAHRPALALTTDRPRPPEARYSAAQHVLDVPPALAQVLRQRARAQGGTLFMVLLAAFHALLYRHTGQREIRVGVPVAGRGRAETAGVVGVFINTLVMEARLDGQTRLADLLAQVRDTAVAAQAHQALPFECLVQALRTAHGHDEAPLFQVMFNHLGQGDRPLRGWPGLQVRRIDLEERAAPFELTLETIERADGGIQANFRYAAELFEPQTIARMAGHYRRLLEALAQASELCLCQVDLLSDAERAQLAQWGVNPHRRGHAELVHRRIERQAAEQPDAPALVFEGEALSYAELNHRANRLAHRLIALGVRPETRVGVALARSVELVVGLLAVMKAGGAYVPLDAEYPAKRIAWMVADSGLRLVLTQEALAHDLPRCDGVTRLALDTLDLTDSATHNPMVALHAENIAYVIYTSGSTGRPKGVANRHGALYNRLVWMQQAYALGEADTVLQKTPFSFDVSVWEFFWPLMLGARLAVARPGDHREPARLVQAIRAHAVSTLHFVPSMLQAFLTHPEVEGCTSLRRIVCSGEALPAEVQNAVFRRLPQAALHNLYGPTEAAIDVTHWTCRDDGRSQVPIGRPIDDTQVHVLDADLNLLPPGAAGELYLGGAGLARGYAERPGLSAERFVADPLGGDGARLYRTGDLVRWNAEGQLDYLGRLDHQVKLRGFRIELGEIEARLLAEPAVGEAVVVARDTAGDTAGGAQLVAYVAGLTGQRLDAAHLRERLAASLPAHMVPSMVVVLDALPLSPNGKVDRKALPAPDLAGNGTRAHEAPQAGTEQALAAIWAEVLGIARVGRTDHFFERGGHSLSSVQVVARVQAALHAELTVADVFRQPVLKDMAALVEAARARKPLAQSLSDIDAFMNSLEEPA